MSEEDQVQLTFEVGGRLPTGAELKLRGSLTLARELHKGESIGLRIIDADGESLTPGDAHGVVMEVAFKDKRDKYGEIESVTRVHTAELAPGWLP